MPSYAELAQEVWWRNQFTPSNMTTILLDPLRHFYDVAADLISAPGDNKHLYGRHRSVNWDLNSRYCTDRDYGTQDPRDRRGSLDWYRAFDVIIQGEALFDACRRVDAEVRAGRLPGLAEWFGTFDGVNVVGWYEGHPSSSDDSHLSHFHGGLWTESANDPATLQRLYATITGEDDVTAQDVWGYRFTGVSNGQQYDYSAQEMLTGTNAAAWKAVNLLEQLHVKIDAWIAAGGDADTAALMAHIDEGLTALALETRDAVADLGEGGAAQVRANAD